MRKEEKALAEPKPADKSVTDAIQELNDRRVKGMLDALNAAQAEFNATFVPVMVLTTDGIIPRIEVKLR